MIEIFSLKISENCYFTHEIMILMFQKYFPLDIIYTTRSLILPLKIVIFHIKIMIFKRHPGQVPRWTFKIYRNAYLKKFSPGLAFFTGLQCKWYFAGFRNWPEMLNFWLEISAGKYFYQSFPPNLFCRGRSW